MYLALRDIRFATGRFALMGSVVALISLLLVMLSGLTAGLANQNTSAIATLDTDAIAFSADEERDASFAQSQVTQEQVNLWQQTDGIAGAEPLGITQTRAAIDDDSSSAASVAVFGADPAGTLMPSSELPMGEVLIGLHVAEDLGVSPGETVFIGGLDMTVAGVVEDLWYSHTPVVWANVEDWQQVAHVPSTEIVGTVVAALIDENADAAQVQAAADAQTETVSMSPESSFSALASYSSENGALTMIQGLLYAISALVILAFLTVWTVQRTRDIAVLKALGASNRYVLGDALGQALTVLIAGAAVGGLVGWAGGALASQAVPFVSSAATTVLPAAGVILIGTIGAAVAVRRVTTVDPLLALGGS